MTVTDTVPGIDIGAALSPAASQRVFRAVLDALARPGLPARLPAPLLPTGAPALPAALLPALALADLGTGIHVMAEDADRARHWAAALRTATSAPEVPLERARLVAAVRPVTGDEVRRLNRSDPTAPEDGALLAVAVAGLTGGPHRWCLTGPGVPGRRAIAPAGLAGDFLAGRTAAVAGYPGGVDVLLVAPEGGLLGLPRTTTIEEERD
jgi:alpha-D-ribose 1-methylphosphonate 5-triphosphate synthase subunit PhnH